MAKYVNASDMIISFGGIVVGCAQATTLTVTRAIDPATCTSSGAWTQGSPGIKGWSTSVNAVYRQVASGDAASNVVAEDVFDLLDDGTEADIEYGTNVAGDKRFAGKALISNFTLSKPDSGVVTWSADLTGNGPLALKSVTTPLVIPA